MAVGYMDNLDRELKVFGLGRLQSWIHFHSKAGSGQSWFDFVLAKNVVVDGGFHSLLFWCLLDSYKYFAGADFGCGWDYEVIVELFVVVLMWL